MKFFFLSLFTLCFGGLTGQQTTLNYLYNSDDILNPERGFYRYTETRASNPSPLTIGFLNDLRENENLTLIFRYVFLDSFLETEVSEEFLVQISEDFEVIREAGFKVILRFAYTDILPAEPPYNDSPVKSLLLDHIAQLKPVIQENSDVILTLQNGFWGVWGENYYSDEFGSVQDAPLTDQNWLDRKEVTDSLLALLPDNRLLSLRYPLLKSSFYEFSIPEDSLTQGEAYTGNIKSRIGYHNDCFLVSANDYTFGDTDSEKPYWETESRYTVMGGETCGDNPQFTNCENALIDLENAHWTYLNDYYHPDVLDRWEQEGCLEEIRKRLGYRIYLNSGTFDENAEAGGVFNFSIQFTNEGFASPINGRDLFLLFIKDEEIYSFLIQEDLRSWYGNSTYTISESLSLPQGMSPGNYDLYLYSPDKSLLLSDDPRYAIQFANEDIWNAQTGYNNLQMSVNINPISAIEDTFQTFQDFEVSVQSSDQIVRINTAVVNYSISVFTLSGQQIISRFGMSGNSELSIGSFPVGLYIIRIIDKDSGRSLVEKFLRN